MRSHRHSRLGPQLLLFIGLFCSPGARAATLVGPVQIPAGLRLDEVGALLERAGVVEAADFVRKAVEPQFVHSLGVPGDSLEGFLCPGTYPLVPGTPPEAVLRLLVEACAHAHGPTERARAEQLGLDRQALVSLASIVEKEGRDSSERALIAAVLLNRLRRGWHLDCPSTVTHALALSEEGFGGTLARGAERLDHPYNTFVHPGLPPGPICSPSAESLKAVLQPADSPRLVWFRRPGGGIEFELDPAERAALDAIRPDPPPAETTRGLHYLVSNELRQFHFQPAIERLGGVWIGVGAEQNYTLAGWQRPELLILLDFDQVIVDLHAVYRVAFLAAEDPREFMALFDRRQSKRLTELVQAAYATDRRRRLAALQALGMARKPVKVRLDRILQEFHAAGRGCFLTDPEQYAHLRELYTTGRVLAVRGDLTARRSLREIGRVLGEHGRTVRALYLSNAEQYFGYTLDFRRNIRALPVDEWSLLLRTRPTSRDYAYVLQWYHNFLRWLERPGVRNVRFLVPQRMLSWRRPVYQVVAEPPETPIKIKRRPPARRTARRSP